MRIRTIFTAALGVVAAVGLTASGLELRDGWRVLDRTADARALGEAFSQILRIPQYLTEERSISTRVLTAPQADPADQASLATVRRDLDTQFAASLAASSQAAALLPRGTGEGLEALRRAVHAVRADIEAAASRPQAERAPLQLPLSRRSLEAQAALGPVMNDVEQRLAQIDPGLGDIGSIARLVLELREAISAFLVPAGPGVRSGRPMTTDELLRIENARGAFSATLARLRSAAGGEAAPAAVRAVFEDVIERGVLAPKRVVDDAVTVGRTGSGYAVDASGWNRNVDTFAQIFELRDAALTQLLANAAEAHSAAKSHIIGLAVILSVLLAGLVVGGWLFRRSVLAALERITQAMAEVSQGKFDIVVPHADRRDEIGELAQALEVFKRSGQERLELQSQREAEELAKQQRAALIETQIQGFAATVNGALERVRESTRAMRSSADSVNESSLSTRQRAETVGRTAEQASNEVQTVAAATEELSASVVEISRQVRNASSVAGEAVAESEAADTNVQGLAASAQKIGDVVRLISDIAAQTNLLALNATIEAARAGDAGKGFAVVASEVKSLASQTSKATEEISGQIADIQAATAGAVVAIQSIARRISEMSEVSASIASAVEEQGASTREIAESIQRTATGTQGMSREVSAMTEAATAMGGVTGALAGAIERVSSESDQLRAEIDGFLGNIRAA